MTFQSQTIHESRATSGVVEEFERARLEIHQSPANVPLWQPIIAKYNPTFVGKCEKALKWSREIVEEWLREGMFAAEGEAESRAHAAAVVEALGDHEEQLSHSRHISLKKARDIGLDILALEDDSDLQDAVLSVHHACIQTFLQTTAIKIVENQLCVGAITAVQLQGAVGVPMSPTPQAADAHGGESGVPVRPKLEPNRRNKKKRKR